MSLLTTFEAIKYIDLAKSSKFGSVQRFICTVLEVDKDTLTTYHIDKIKVLRQGSNITKAMAKSALSEDMIIRNIKKNIRNAAVIAELDKDFCNTIKSADNLDLYQKKQLTDIPDFSRRLYEVLKETLLNQESDLEQYGEKYKNAKTLDYGTIKDKLDRIDGSGSHKDDKKVSAFYSLLKAVSDTLYQDIQDNEKRFHASSIQSMLLTLGADKYLPTYGYHGNDSKEMSFYLNNDNNLFIIGEGGIGKTTLLINELNEIMKDDDTLYIPIFITLNRLKNNNISQSGSYIFSELIKSIKRQIISSHKDLNSDPFSIEDELVYALDYEYAPKKVLFLLDGFNEISNVAGSVSRDRIKKEIIRLSKYKNVRIILTSRPFYDSNKSFDGFDNVYASGIADSTLNDYLNAHKTPFNVSDQTYELLHNPLFLLMYVSNHENGVKDATTKGAILYEFCNGDRSIYNELTRIKDSDYIEEPLPDYTPLLFDFIMPAIAALMEMNDSFYITPVMLDDIVEQIKSLTAPFDQASDKHFKDKYDLRGSLSSLATDLIRSGSDLIKVLVDELSFLQQDLDSNLFFVHQYIKDYFASLFRILTYRQTIWDSESLYFKYAHTLMDINTFDLTKQIADKSGLCDLKRLESLLDACPDKDDVFYINNLLRMLSSFNNGSLSGFTFDSFDFTNLPLTMYQFSDDLSASVFKNCKFSDISFSIGSSGRSCRVFTVYDAKPAMCEIAFGFESGIVRIYDLNSESLLYSSIIDLFSTDYLLDFDHVDTMELSQSGRYLVLYDSDSVLQYFYVYDLTEKILTTRAYYEGAVHELYAITDDDRLIILSDLDDVFIYNLSHKNPKITDNPVDRPVLFAETEEMAPIHLNIALHSMLMSKGYIHIPSNLLHGSRLYSTGSNLILLIAKANDLTSCVYVYSCTSKESVPVYFDDSINDMPNGTMASVMTDNAIYFTFGDSIHTLDLESLHVKRLITLYDTNRFIALNCNNDMLFAVTDSRVYDISISDKEIEDTHDLYVDHMISSHAESSNYIVYGDTSVDSTKAYIYRLDQRTFTSYTCPPPPSITHVLNISDNRIIVIYSSGYVAVLSAEDMSLLNNFRLPYGQRCISADYNSQSEEIAVITFDGSSVRSFSKPNSLYILSTDDIESSAPEFEPILSSLYYETCLCYSLDGRYLFLNDMGTIRIFDADNCDEYDPIEIGEHIENIKAYDGYIIVIHGDDIVYPNIFMFNDDILRTGLSIAIIDIIDGSFVRSYLDSIYRNAKWPHDKICATKISDHVFEKIYTDELSGHSRYDIEQDRFFYETNDSLSDYYQDGILIKCSSRYIPEGDNVHKLSDMTTKYACIRNGSYYAMNKEGDYVKRDIAAKTYMCTRSNIKPNLYIHGCSFIFDDPPVKYILDIIGNNGGLINPDGIKRE